VAPYWIAALAIILAIEIHALIGNRGLATQKYVTAPAARGVIHAGFGTAVLLYLVASVLL
jgi:succinate dehydrogenase hydrophobic anchor subunit